MSVLLETSLGEIVIDLLVGDAPKVCEKYVLKLRISLPNFEHFTVHPWVTANNGGIQLLEIMQGQIL